MTAKHAFLCPGRPLLHWQFRIIVILTNESGGRCTKMDFSGSSINGSAEGSGVSLRSCVRSLLDYFLFYKDITFRYCSSAVDSVFLKSAISSFVLFCPPFLLLSSFLTFQGHSAHHAVMCQVFS